MQKTKFNLLSFISKYLKGSKEVFIVVIVSSILLIIPLVGRPIMNQMLVDNVFTGISPEWFDALLAAGIALVLYEFVIRALVGRTWKMNLKSIISSSSEMVWHTLRLPMSFFSDKYAGDLAARAQLGEDVSNNLRDKVYWFIGSLVLILVYLFFMLKYSLWLSAFAVFHIVLSLAITKSVNKHLKSLNREMQKSAGELEGYTTSLIDNIEAIKGSSSELGFFQRWSNCFSVAQNTAIKCGTDSLKYSEIPGILESVATVLVLGAGTYYVIQGEMTIGMLMAFQAFMDASIKPVAQVINDVQRIASISAKCERMDEVLSAECDVPEDIIGDEYHAERKLNGQVEMIDVTFGYDVSCPPLIEHFNLSVRPGGSVAFVGPSGCGKSTLANLISGLYQPWEGTILFGGKPQSAINRNVFASSVAIVNQNIVLFDGSIADNVKIWDGSIEDFAMVLACHDAQIHSEIASRKGSYDSHVENSGSNFSGGQRQRIEIASAFAKEPTIIIMDEGTSALDAVTEANLMIALKNMGVTLIMIAHRLSTIRDCDEIIVMDHGKPVERGTHQQLIDQNGYYAELMRDN